MKKNRALIILHITVFIWGFTGILGKEIDLPAFQLVWWRMMIAALAMLIWAWFSRKSLIANAQEIAKFAGVGLLTAAHWICFFASIKASNISTALAFVSTTSFFVALVAPFIRRTKFSTLELFLGVMVIAGLSIIFNFEPERTLGIILSLLAALFAAIFSSLNSVLVQKHAPTKIAFYGMLFGAVGISTYLAATSGFGIEMFSLSGEDWFYLIILGVFATAFAFIVSIDVMKVLSPFTCALTINLEPLYTIVIALWLYGESEYMTPQFYLGSVLILSTLFIEAWVSKKKAASL
jgi:drug/metabolite transporter (DMT)-like permease